MGVKVKSRKIIASIDRIRRAKRNSLIHRDSDHFTVDYYGLKTL